VSVVAGIDEAGYGPLLGPLVVAAAAFRLAPDAAEGELDRITSDGNVRRHGLPTADSKRLYHAGGSLRALETSTLGHLALGRGSLPVRMAGLLEGALDFSAAELDELPWYGEPIAAEGALPPLLELRLPRVASLDQVLERAAWHEAWLAERGCRFVDLFLAPVVEPRFNRLSSAAGTKAWTLFHATGRLIETLVRRFPADELIIHVDRQGGRIHYGDLLQTFFPLAPLTTVRERPISSAYRLDWPGRSPVHIDFHVKADVRRAAVALASVAAKTTRELFMERLNAWFSSRHPPLQPTAGYGTDGQRFAQQVEALGLVKGRLRERLLRCR